MSRQSKHFEFSVIADHVIYYSTDKFIKFTVIKVLLKFYICLSLGKYELMNQNNYKQTA